MKVGDLVGLFYAREEHLALVIEYSPCSHYAGDNSWTFLFCDDGSTLTYKQEDFDCGVLEFEVISESR